MKLSHKEYRLFDGIVSHVYCHLNGDWEFCKRFAEKILQEKSECRLEKLNEGLSNMDKMALLPTIYIDEEPHLWFEEYTDNCKLDNIEVVSVETSKIALINRDVDTEWYDLLSLWHSAVADYLYAFSMIAFYQGPATKIYKLRASCIYPKYPLSRYRDIEKRAKLRIRKYRRKAKSMGSKEKK